MKREPDYQPDLLKVFADNLRDPHPGPSDEGSPALAEWMQLLGLRGAGESLAGASLLRADERELHFAVRPPPAAPLRVAVDWDRGQDCFFRIGPYAVSYVANKRAAPEICNSQSTPAATDRAAASAVRPRLTTDRPRLRSSWTTMSDRGRLAQAH